MSQYRTFQSVVDPFPPTPPSDMHHVLHDKSSPSATTTTGKSEAPSSSPPVLPPSILRLRESMYDDQKSLYCAPNERGEALHLLSLMLKIDPDERITASEALLHPYFWRNENISRNKQQQQPEQQSYKKNLNVEIIGKGVSKWEDERRKKMEEKEEEGEEEEEDKEEIEREGASKEKENTKKRVDEMIIISETSKEQISKDETIIKVKMDNKIQKEEYDPRRDDFKLHKRKREVGEGVKI
jgi:serine/threonine protein kinase